MTGAGTAAAARIEADFTTQLLYCSVKTGVAVNIADLGLNVIFDLVSYGAAIDAATLEKVDGKKGNLTAPLSVLDMLHKKGGRG